MPKIVISSGHGLHVPGAIGFINEVEEARRVVNRVAEILGGDALAFHDDVSTSQDENLQRIVDFHNSQERLIDCSLHFNAYIETEGARGCEVLYVSQSELADELSLAISKAGGLIDRGAHERHDLYFLNQTEEAALLIEVCFVDARADVEAYQANFERICVAIARTLADFLEDDEPAREPSAQFPVSIWSGRVSWFGGPVDDGVAPDEGLAFLYDVSDAPYLFLPEQPPDTTGLARRLDPDHFYLATRWNYDEYPKEMLASGDYLAWIEAPRTGKRALAVPADWGPAEDTGRLADISPGLMDELGIVTDEEVIVIFPVRRVGARE